MTERIFISYAYQDREYLTEIADELHKQGIEVDKESLLLDHVNDFGFGSTIEPMLLKRIQEASKIVVLWTEEGAKSQFVNYEVGIAKALGKPIIVAVPKNQKSKVPFALSEFEILEIEDKRKMTADAHSCMSANKPVFLEMGDRSAISRELFDIVNPTNLHSLVDIFSDKTKCAAAILDARTQPITPESRLCNFCHEVRRTESGLKICRESDLMGMRLARKEFEQTGRSKPVFYKCGYGLVDACAPIVVGNKIMGYLMAGQFRCGPSSPIPAAQHSTKHASKAAKEESPKDIFRGLATNHSPKLERLLGEAEQKKEFVDEGTLRELFEEVLTFDLKQFRSFYNELTELINLLNAFIAKLRNWHKPEQAYEFMKGAIGIENVGDLYELMVTDLPLLFDAVGASIFVVHHDHHKGDRLVLQKTSFPDLKPYEKTAYYDKGEGLTGWVWANKRCLRIKDLQNPEELNRYTDLKWKRKLDDSDHHSSFLAVPMIGHTGEVSGVLRLPHKKGDVPFTSDDEIFLRFLADHLSKVIECQTAEDVFQQTTGRSGLANAATELLAARSRKEILEAGLNSSILLFGASGKMHFMNLLLPNGLKWIIYGARGTLDFAVAWRNRCFELDEGFTGKALRTAMNTKLSEGDIAYELKDASREGEYIEAVSNARSVMAVPILWGKNVYGVIAVVSEKKYEFTREKDLRILESLAVLTGIALHNYEQRRSKIIKALLCILRYGRLLWGIIVRTKLR